MGQRRSLNQHTYWLLDNVVTNGESKRIVEPQLKESGYDPLAMPLLIFIDRQQGGVERLATAGYGRIEVAFNLLDITFVLGELGVWPATVIESVEAEIKAHQFL